MDEVKVLFVRFLEIQTEQDGLLKDIASEENMQLFWTTSVEHSAHMRDHHGRPWDHGIAVEEQQKIGRKLVELNQRYKQNQEQLKVLRQQLFATFTS